jgi:hypothetical protein
VKKEQIGPFIESLEKAMNKIAVEPISIKKEKNIGSSMEWEFEKPPEMVFRSQWDVKEKQTVVPDHLEALRMRYVNGEISEIEYKRMKSFLESDKN